MDILRITARWTGFTGAPGYSAFHFTTDGGFWDGGLLGDSAQVAADGAANRVRDAFSEINSILPGGVSIAAESEAEILDSDSGEIIGMVSVPSNRVNASPTGGGWSGASGAVVNWRTNDYRFGRRIRGRTFIVPLSGGAYEDDGTLESSTISSLNGFALEMINGEGPATFGVWSRPRDGGGGVFATVTNHSVPDMAAVLRSRRD